MKTKNKIIFSLLICLSAFSTYAQLAKCKGKYFGNIISGSVPSTYNTYWNQVTSENASKWGSVEGTMGQYNFGGSDVCYNWAKNNNGIFKYHNLIWGGQTPGWVNTAATATITNNIDPYFKAVRDHYAPMGGLKLIDVLNEPVNTPMPGNLKAALTAGYQAEPANANDLNNQYGWAIWCFQMARKYFPDATLLINEYNIEMNWNNCRAPYIAMVNAIKNAPNLTDGKKNLIDGIGLQCHGINTLTAANFKACIDELWTKTGVAVHITEFDATADPDEAKQKTVYSTLIPVAWEHPHVAGITLWGYIQGSTWIGGNKTLGPGGTDSGLLYSGSYTTSPYGERPAMTWLKQYFASQPSLSCCPAPGPFASCTNAAPAVSLTAPADNSGYEQGTAITLSANASVTVGTISKVEFYAGTTLIGTDNTSPYSISWTPTSTGSFSVTAVATDNSSNKTTSTAITIKVSVPQAPYNNIAHPIPGTIQMEEFDLGGNGFAYLDNTPGSQVTPVVNFRTDTDVDIENCTDAGGGYNIGYATAGEWLEYTVDVKTAGIYNLDLRVACSGDARTVSVSMDGVDLATNIAIPNTAGWQTWTTTTVKNLSLKAGKQILRFTIGATDYVNLNYITFTLANTPPTVSITAPSDKSSFTTLQTATITATATDADGISTVQFYDDTTLLGSDNTAPYSFAWSGMKPGTHSITVKATDSKGMSTTSSPITITIQAVQGPYKGIVHQIPGRIEAEEYDLGGEGLAYHEANTNGNEGKATLRNDEVDIEVTGDVDGAYDIGYILQGEWLEYTVNVASTDSYDLNVRVAANGDGKVFHIEMDGTNVSGVIAVPNTGGWQTWKTVTIPGINLTGGQHIMKIAFDASYMNLNYVEFNSPMILTGISNNEGSSFKTLPNPFSEEGFKVLKDGEFQFKIIDVTGVTVEEGKAYDQATIGSQLKTGIYFLTVEDGVSKYTQKVIRK